MRGLSAFSSNAQSMVEDKEYVFRGRVDESLYDRELSPSYRWGEYSLH